MTRLLPLTTCLFLGLCVADAAGQSGSLPTPDEAVKNAIEAAEKMDRAYSESRMTARETVYDASSTTPRYVTDDEYLRSGEAARASKTVVQSTEANVVQGETKVYGGWPQKRFSIVRNDPHGGFAIGAFGSTETFSTITTDRARPLFAPYQVYDLRLADFLRMEEVSVESVRHTVVGDRPAIELVANYRFVDDISRQPGHVRYHLHFAPETWVFLGFSRYTNPEDPKARYSYHELTYAPGESWPPRLTQLEIAIEDPTSSGMPLSRSVYEVKSLEFGPVEREEFTLAAYGLEEPVNPVMSLPAAAVPDDGWPWMWIAVGIGLTVLALAFITLSRRRRGAA